ncbi:hypothetical protein KP509_10G035100 [Ceratopteris richardii]|uniref:Eukaryotic translation initiation factor 4 gamma 2 n=1 Tax=Ceratopteris richardii TaxID=49495 RepID=A0A8T2TUW1_CERRI|nr:hypothetical protein KP509_10G035100 [Ceratopteris richardii]
MSHYQSRADRSDSQHRRSARSGGGTAYQRSSSGKGSGAGGQGPSAGPIPVPPSSVQPAPVHSSKRSGGSNGQTRTHGTGITEVPENQRLQNMSSQQTQHVNNAQSGSRASNGSLSRSSKPGISSTTSSETAPVIPKPEPSLSSVQPQLSFQFGSIGTFVQIPARTSSAPPNLDEQKQDLLRFQTVTVQPSKAPIPSGAQQIGPRPQGPHSGVHVQPQSHPQSIIRNQPQQTVTSMSSGVLHPPYHQQGQQHPMPVHISQPSSHLQSSPVVTSQAHIPVQAHMIPQPQQQGLVQLSYSQHALQPQLQHNGGQVLKYPQSIAGPSLMGPPLAPLPGPMQTTQMTHQMSAGLPPGMTGAPFGVVPVPNPFIPPRTSSAVKIVHPETHEELKFDFKSSKSDSFHEHVPIATAGAQGIPVGNGALHSRPTLGYAGANHHQNPYSAHQNGSYSAAMQHYYQPSPVIGNVQASAVEGPVPNKMLTVPSSSMATSKEATAGSSSVVNPSVPAPSSEATSSGKEDLPFTPGPTSQVNESKDGPDDRAMKNQSSGVHSVPVKDAAQVVKEVKHESSVLVKDSHSVTSSNAEVRQTNKKKKKKEGPSRVNSIDGAKASKVQEVKKQGESTVLDAQKEMTNTSKSIERAENNDQRPLIEGVLPDTAALKAPEPELHHSNVDLEMDKHCTTDVSVKNEVEDGSTKESLIVEGSVSLNVSDLNVVPHTNTVHKTQGAEQDLGNNEATDRQSDACTVQTESLDSADSYGEKFDDSGLKYVPSNKATESAKPTHLQLSDVEIEVKSDQHKNDVLDVEASYKAASTEEIKIVAVSEASNEDKKTEAQVEPVQQQSNVQGQFSSNKDVSEEAPISAAPDVKPSGKKKKMKVILAKADAAGTTADLYNAYKAPQEKKQDALTPTNMVSSKAPSTNVVKQVIAEEEIKSSKEVDDWEDAAELPSPKVLVADDTSNKSGDRQLSKDKEGETYTRDFLLTFKEQNMELPLDFEVRPDIVELLLNPQAAFQQFAERDARSGRMMDMQLNGGLRRGASGTFDDDRWSKQPQGPHSPLWPDNFSDMGPVNGFRPGSSQGLIPRMSPSVRSGIAAPPLVPGLIPGKPPTPGAGPGVFRTNTVDSDRWQKMPGGQKGLIPSPQTSLPPVHKAEKRYEVGKISGEEELKQRQIKGILNKLTPQNFQKLFEQVKEVNIQSAVTLTGVISQIFDKALTEPTFCEMYATFCKQLAADMPEFTEDGEKVTFKRVLLNKCQEEFHRGEKEQEEASESEQDSRVEEQEEKQLKAKRRMLGNIRFIGELYKKHMLTERIMHECIFKLLGDYANPEEEDLEALCKLMSTIGHMIDHPARKEHIDAYFDRMNRHSDNQKISSRIRFMLKDVIDLRRNGWQERRKVEGPKRIEEVHRDAVQERQASVAQAGRISRGPSIGTSAGRRFAAGSAESGTRGITSPMFPPNTPLGSASGTRGLQGQGSVRTPIVQDVRVEDKLLMERSAPIPLSQRSGDEGSLTLGPQGGLGRGMSIRNQPSGSGEVRRFGPGSMPAYSGAPHAAERPITPPEKPILDRPLSASGPRPSRHLERTLSEKAPGTSNYQNQHLGSNSRPSTAPVHPALDEEQLRKKSESALNEYFSARDLKEATLCVEELRAPTFYPTMVSTWISLSFEKGDVDRELLAKLLISLQKLEPIVLKQEQVIQGFQLIMESLEDVILDTPKAPEYLAQMLVRLISAGTLPFHQVGDMLKNADIHPNNIVLDIFGKMLSGLRQDKGERYLIDMWQSSRTQLQGFLDANNLESSSFSDFLQDHSLQCLRMDLGHGTFNNNVQEVGAQLLQHLGKNEPVLETEKWLEMLMTQLLKHTIPVGSEDASESDLLRKRFADYQMLLKRFGSDKEKQQQYIVAMQLYVHSIGHPAGLMTALVKALYELEIISESAIFKWVEDVHDPTVGRDMALKTPVMVAVLRDST